MRCLGVFFFAVITFSCTTTDRNPAKKQNLPRPTAEGRFPDYRPKTSPDTVLDYRPQISAQLEKLPQATLDNLPRLLELLEDYQKRSQQNPGKIEEGNVILGADPREYVPSDAELIQSEIGNRINQVADAAAPDALKKAGLTARQAEYGAITYRHVDVMGSGRFFYASRPAETIISLVE